MKRLVLLPLLALTLLLFAPASVSADPPPAHQYIQEYEGSETCEICHIGIADEVVHSVHYTWSEKMEHYSPIPATISTINWLGVLNEDLGIAGGCGRCHIGPGPMPGSAADTDGAKAQVDCLICHAEVYDMNQRFPVQDEEGNWTIPGDRSLLAARTATRPSDDMCLRCHLNAGGGQLFKRGLDFAPVADRHVQESTGDIHAERGMVCVDCHAAPEHRFYGFAPTLWSRDREERLECSACHSTAPHQNAMLNQHDRLDCRTCHVLDTGGLMQRDWTAEAVYDPITELYGSADTLAPANSVAPTYKWFNGERLIPALGWPGAYDALDSKIQPFKIYQGTVPVNPNNGAPWPLKLGVFYKTGDLEQAIAAGAVDAGLEYDGEWEAETYTVPLQLSHGIVAADQALSCNDCHVANGRMDFAALGYDAERVAILESLSQPNSADTALQVDFANPEAAAAPEPINEGPAATGFADRLAVWSVWGAVLIALAAIALVAALMARQRRKLLT